MKTILKKLNQHGLTVQEIFDAVEKCDYAAMKFTKKDGKIDRAVIEINVKVKDG